MAHTGEIPSSLHRSIRVSFKAERTEAVMKLRDIRASSIGHLVGFKVRFVCVYLIPR
jgi:hypothetical protein